MEPRQWHTLATDRVLSELDSAMTGLSSDQAGIRLRSEGANRLPAPPKRSLTRQFLAQFHNVLIYVLLGSALIRRAHGELTRPTAVSALGGGCAHTCSRTDSPTMSSGIPSRQRGTKGRIQAV